MSAAEAALGRPLDVVYDYLGALNGMALAMTPDEAARVAALDGVVAVYGDTLREMTTDVGPLHIGAPAIWNGETTFGVATEGEGVIIGIIDSGINSQHPSFADLGGDGYDHTNPYGPGVYNGWCVANPSFCNDKLIAAYTFHPNGGSPEDTDGHGSHTASTSGGNRHEAVFPVGTDVFTRTVQGVAPHANIVAYKVCDPSCPGTSSIQAVDSAILADQVDVLNYSISGGDDPWNDPVDLAFLDAFNAGIFVSASAGNDGPGAGTVAKTGPWNAAVAASTINRIIANTLDVDSSTPPPPPTLVDVAAVQGENVNVMADIAAEIGYNAGNATGCSAHPPGFFTGAIALIQRGGCTFAAKVSNAAAAGAIAVVVYNNVGGPPIFMGGTPPTPPSVFIDKGAGDELAQFIIDNAPVTATINAGAAVVINDDWEDIVAGFSSRGPSQHDLLKPDYIAPGVNILAAVAQSGGDPVQYGFLGGTSMSSPHGAGAAALMVALHPDWSPAAVKSALASTATDGLLKEDGATPADPLDVGSGLLNLAGAGNVGLVFDETGANYEAANPDTGGDPKTLNQPSTVDQFCLNTCSWTRTATSVLPYTMSYDVNASGDPDLGLTVDPPFFTIDAGGTQVITVTADVSSALVGDWIFGDVTISPAPEPTAPRPLPHDAFADAREGLLQLRTQSGRGVGTRGAPIFSAINNGLAQPDQHLPVAVVPAQGILPDDVAITTRRDAGSWLVPGNIAAEITDLTTQIFGLEIADQFVDSIFEDNDPSATFPDIFFDDLDGAFWMTYTVPANTYALVVEVLDTTSPDLDMAVGYDTNGDGLPSADELICQSADFGSLEICEELGPTSGDWWFVIINFEASGPGVADTVVVGLTAVPNVDGGNMWADGPVTWPVGEPFDLRVYWNEPALEAGDVAHGLVTLGTDPGNPGNIGSIPVRLSRVEDDVAKAVDNPAPAFGETLTFTITVQPNVHQEDLGYFITDTIPAGLTYVPGSATASEGTVSVAGNVLTYEGVAILPSTGYDLVPFTSPIGGYLPLAGFFAPFSLPGDADEGGWILNLSSPFLYRGSSYSQIIWSINGTVEAGTASGQTTSFLNLSMPDPTPPNNLLAPFWSDLDLTTAGNWYVGALTDGVDVWTILEWENAPQWGNPGATATVQLWQNQATGQTWFTYGGFAGTWNFGTIGIEDETGTDGFTYWLDGDGPLPATDAELLVNFFEVVPEPIVITYQATMDTCGQALTNEVLHNTDNPGSLEVSTDVGVTAPICEPAISLVKTVGTTPGVCASTTEITVDPATDVYYCYEVTNTGNIPFGLHDLADNQLGSIFAGLAYDLMPGASVNTVEAGLTISATIEAPTINIATWTAYTAPVNGQEGNGFEAQAQASATVNVVFNPAISLAKTVGTAPGLCAGTTEITVDPGTDVYYCYEVTNTGNIPFGLHDLVDDPIGTILSGFAYVLEPGMSVNTVDAGLAISATIETTTINTATWTAYEFVDEPVDGLGRQAQAMAMATVNVADEPAITLTKTVGLDPSACSTETAIEVQTGTEVIYCFSVENTGDVTLSLHDLVDDHLGTLLNDFPTNLTPGATVILTASAVITEDTINTATWTAFVIGGPTASDDAMATVTVAAPTDVGLVGFGAAGSNAVVWLTGLVALALIALVWRRRRPIP